MTLEEVKHLFNCVVKAAQGKLSDHQARWLVESRERAEFFKATMAEVKWSGR